MSFHMAQLSAISVTLYMSELEPTMLHTWEHHKVTLLNFLDYQEIPKIFIYSSIQLGQEGF